VQKYIRSKMSIDSSTKNGPLVLLENSQKIVCKNDDENATIFPNDRIGQKLLNSTSCSVHKLASMFTMLQRQQEQEVQRIQQYHEFKRSTLQLKMARNFSPQIEQHLGAKPLGAKMLLDTENPVQSAPAVNNELKIASHATTDENPTRRYTKKNQPTTVSLDTKAANASLTGRQFFYSTTSSNVLQKSSLVSVAMDAGTFLEQQQVEAKKFSRQQRSSSASSLAAAAAANNQLLLTTSARQDLDDDFDQENEEKNVVGKLKILANANSSLKMTNSYSSSCSDLSLLLENRANFSTAKALFSRLENGAVQSETKISVASSVEKVPNRHKNMVVVPRPRSFAEPAKEQVENISSYLIISIVFLGQVNFTNYYFF